MGYGKTMDCRIVKAMRDLLPAMWARQARLKALREGQL
jgi:hypothetical protein